MRDDFDKDWPHGHITRDGQRVEIIRANKKGPDPIVALIGHDELLRTYRDDGRYCLFDDCHHLDLINAPAPKRTFEIWINFYPFRGPDYFNSKEAADDFADRDRISRKRFVITEGEFDA